MERMLCLIIGYLFGLIQTGFLYGKLHGVDIRDYGSGNAGTTNTMRVFGKKAGAITYLGDALKALAAGLLVRFIFSGNEDMMFVLLLYTGLGVILGHNFPVYMKFKGGKGIAASSGAVAALGDWKLVLLAFVTFLGVLLISKYVSLASLCFLTGFFFETVLFGCLDLLPGLAPEHRPEAYVIAFIWMVLAYVQHRSNIGRLIAGNERRIGQSRKKDCEKEEIQHQI